MPGEAESGDQHLVMPLANGALVAVVDGLGHGPEAAEASGIAVATLERHAGESLISLMQRCHQALLRSRGAVMTLADLDGRSGQMTWLGVGNVEGFLLRADPGGGTGREAVLLRGGIVGHRLPGLRTSDLPVNAGDVLILATDGISSGFTQGLAPSTRSEPALSLAKGQALGQTPQEIADRILARHWRGTDDALVLVARYRGGESW
jgi:hypothetical protein